MKVLTLLLGICFWALNQRVDKEIKFYGFKHRQTFNYKSCCYEFYSTFKWNTKTVIVKCRCNRYIVSHSDYIGLYIGSVPVSLHRYLNWLKKWANRWFEGTQCSAVAKYVVFPAGIDILVQITQNFIVCIIFEIGSRNTGLQKRSEESSMTVAR